MSIVKKSFKLSDFVDLSSFTWGEESVTALAEAINASELGQYYTASWNSSKSRLDMFDKTKWLGLYMTATECGCLMNGGSAISKACSIASANYPVLYIMLAVVGDGSCYAGGFKYNDSEYWRNACEKLGDGYVGIVSQATQSFYYSNGSNVNTYYATSSNPSATGTSCLLYPEFFYGSLAKHIVKVRGYRVPEGQLYTVSGNTVLNLGFPANYESYAVTDGGED
jgi:hypothetical protein